MRKTTPGTCGRSPEPQQPILPCRIIPFSISKPLKKLTTGSFTNKEKRAGVISNDCEKFIKNHITSPKAKRNKANTKYFWCAFVEAAELAFVLSSPGKCTFVPSPPNKGGSFVSRQKSLLCCFFLQHSVDMPAPPDPKRQ
jgi:hypothetical protein